MSSRSVGFLHRSRCIDVYHTCTDNRFFGLFALQTSTVKLRIFLLIGIKLIVLSFLYEYDNFVFLAQLLWTLCRWTSWICYVNMCWLLLFCCVENKEILNPESWIEAARYSNHRIALKFDRRIGSSTAKVPVKFQSDRTILNTNPAASRFQEILQ